MLLFESLVGSIRVKIRAETVLWHTASVRSSKSILIAIEGIDGAGKTTQAEMLTESLRAAGLGVVASREPTYGTHGNRIRESAATGRLSLDEELQAFIDDRREHVETVVGPALEEGRVVVLDRYYYSTIAYQGARGADIGRIREVMEEFAPVPDAVFLIDVLPTTGLHRIAESRGDTPNAFENSENLTSVREVFLRLDDPNIIRIDGGPSVEQVHEEILRAFVERPLKARLCAKSYGCEDPFHCGFHLSHQCEWSSIKSSIGRAQVASG